MKYTKSIVNHTKTLTAISVLLFFKEINLVLMKFESAGLTVKIFERSQNPLQQSSISSKPKGFPCVAYLIKIFRMARIFITCHHLEKHQKRLAILGVQRIHIRVVRHRFCVKSTHADDIFSYLK